VEIADALRGGASPGKLFEILMNAALAYHDCLPSPGAKASNAPRPPDGGSPHLHFLLEDCEMFGVGIAEGPNVGHGGGRDTHSQRQEAATASPLRAK
jgi:hypothetical protein